MWQSEKNIKQATETINISEVTKCKLLFKEEWNLKVKIVHLEEKKSVEMFQNSESFL